MGAPLKPTATNALTSSANSSSTILNDLVSRMNAQTGGTMQEEQKAAFSKWLERHTNATASADGLGQSSKAMPVQAKPAAQPQQSMRDGVRSGSASTPGEAQQAARAAANRKAEQPHSKDGSANKVAAKSQNKTPSADSAKKLDDRADQVDDSKDPDEVAFTTQMGEGSAVVRELQPPSDVKTSDPASMMAWLGSLTQSDAKLAQAQADAKETGLGKAEGRDGTSSSVAAMHALLAGQGEPGAVHGVLNQMGAHSNTNTNANGLDISGWQASQAMAQLSLQTAMGAASQPAGETGAASVGDPLAGLMASQNGQIGQASAFGQVANAKHVTETLNTPVTAPQFADELADKVSLFVRNARDDGPMTAELHLNPAEMGPINVKIALDGQNAQVDFAATALETRKAIEASLPLLSSALDEVGLSLTGGGVSSQTPQQSFGQSFGQSDGSASDGAGRSGVGRVGRSADDGHDEPVGRAVSLSRLNQRGGLDLYA